MVQNYKQIFAIKDKNERTIRQLCPKANNQSGIYVFYRTSAEGYKFAYVGLATKSLLTRMAQHLSGYQHIDLSIKKWGLYSQDNPFGYKADVLCYCSEAECNEKEQEYIKLYANNGYQMRNVTGGSQGVGKFNINDNKPAKGYRDGLAQGELNAQKFVAKLFEKNLTYGINGKPNQNKQKALEKFEKFIEKGK